MTSGRRWTAAEDALLFDEGRSAVDIALRTGRGVSGVRHRRKVLANAGHKLPKLIRSDGGIARELNPHDAAMGAERPCCRCLHTFQPTVRRRMMCKPCFKRGDPGPFAA